ncbi:hypothetical protein BGX33_008185 [Mortierella sp. NVP41]|nr:hypothetical protein BGX33_008185 [Mortierella sp. NVP41]
MGTLTLQIHSPAHSPHQFSVTVDRHSTVNHLKKVVCQHLVHSSTPPSPTTVDLGLVFDGHALNDTDTLDKVFEKVDCATSLPHIHLIVSSSELQSPAQVNEPCSPAPLHFHDQFTSSTPAPVAHGSTTPSSQPPTATTAENTPMPGTSERCHNNNNNMSEGSPTTSVPGEKATFPVPPAYFTLYPQFLAPFQYQYVIVNGMPYLAPSCYIPLLHMQQQFGMTGPTTTAPQSGPAFNSPVNGLQQQNQPQREAGAGAVAPDGNAQDQAARGQRRAASLWLLLKLAFGVYLFSQNGSIERIVLLHIAALIIFLHQTGRLRIVRRVPRPLQDGPRDPAVNAAEQHNAVPFTNHTDQHVQVNTTATTTTPTDSGTHDTTNPTSSSTTSKVESHKDDALLVSDAKDRPVKLDSPPTVGQDNATASTDNTGPRNTTTEQASPASSAPAQQPRDSTWRHVEHGILTFIASLIPTPPPENEQIDANAVAAAERAL